MFVEENAEKLFKNGKVLDLSPIDTMSYQRLRKIQERVLTLAPRIAWMRPDVQPDWGKALAFAKVCARSGPKPKRPKQAHLRERSNWNVLQSGICIEMEYQFAVLLILFVTTADSVAQELERRAQHFEEVNETYAERGWAVTEPDDLYQCAGVCQDLFSSVDPHEILMMPSSEWRDCTNDMQQSFYLE